MTLTRARDFILYVVIGVAVAICAVWYATSGGPGGHDLLEKWVGLAAMTLTLFGYAILHHRRFLGRLTFWLVISALLLLHLAAFLVVLRRAEHWKVLWFVLLFPVENIAIDTALLVTGHDVLGRRRSR